MDEGTGVRIPCLMALRDTVRFPCGVLGPVERSAFLRLAKILRSDTGGLPACVSG